MIGKLTAGILLVGVLCLAGSAAEESAGTELPGDATGRHHDAMLEAHTAPVWNAAHTRLVVISLAGFQGEKPGHTSFSTEDRLDDPLVELFRQRGVPEQQILYLKDSKATTAEVEDRVPAFLAQSKPEEILIFYYSSHGGYDPKTGAHTYTTFDGSIPIGWFVGKIEKHFLGTAAMIFSDCCYSGGMVNLVKDLPPGRTAFGALSTTGSHNVGYSGWRFTDVLMRAWKGDRAMDADHSGTIDFGELCGFAERYMAFVAEGKPLHALNGSFPPDLVLAKTALRSKDGVGRLIEARDGKDWFKGEVVDVKNDPAGTQRFLIHFTDKNRYARLLWVGKSEVRTYEFHRFSAGAKVEIRDPSGAWVPGNVIGSFENMHECHYAGKTAFSDEWIPPGRIRKPTR